MSPRSDFSLTAALDGRRLLVTGSTGFIGKVFLSMLLDRCQGVGKVYVLVRPRPGREPEERFFDTVNGSPAFAALREKHGDGFEAFLRGKVEVLKGDATEADFGLTASQVETLKGKVDAVLNIAGLVAMSPALDDSLRINAHGARYGAQLALALGAKLVHMSTAYVAGLRAGEVHESEAVAGYSPKGQAFSAADELAACGEFAEALEARASGEMMVTFRDWAAARLKEKGRPITPKAVEAGAQRQAKRWIDEQLVLEGRRRALAWGWPNTYCFTKAIGEQLIAAAPGLDYTIVRPSVVESSMRYPFPGWNEGLTTSAPMILAMCTGHHLWPAHPTAPLDIVPVDLVASSTIAATAALLAGRHRRIYHQGSSLVNPFPVTRIMRHIGQYRRRHYKDHAPDALWAHWLWTRLGVFTVSERAYRRWGVPMYRGVIGRLSKLLGEPKVLSKLERELGQVEHVVDTFLPFIHDIDCVFRTDGMRELYAALPAAEKELLPWDPENIDWRGYWFDIHTEGLRRWVFPGFPGRNGGPLNPSNLPVLNKIMRSALDIGHQVLYGTLFKTTVVGAQNVPNAPGFIVAANHASHLDMGLIKYALGPSGRDLVAMAAKDYFFKNPALGYFFSHYTNLLPIGRGRGVKDSLAAAGRILKKGRSLLIFPEATRSLTGQIASFKPTVGYLALQSKADVLPACVRGTYRALPKGSVLPRDRRLAAHLGKTLTYSELHKQTKHLPPKEAYRAATNLIESAVRALENESAKAAEARWADRSR
ncbi:MAG: SDR family oxidoreductase [Elusimicrobia bacterium]|nr:SDR family oxidoreductase [Elusimicrobiota bacterium]